MLLDLLNCIAHQVLYSQLLELQHHIAQIAAQDFWVSLLLQVSFEAALRVQPEALARSSTPSTTTALVSRCLGEQQTGGQIDIADTNKYTRALQLILLLVLDLLQDLQVAYKHTSWHVQHGSANAENEPRLQSTDLPGNRAGV